METHAINQYEEAARNTAASAKAHIHLIPDDVKIDSNFLAGLSNEQFVTAFRQLQELLVRIYDDVERAPFEWGYPDFQVTAGYMNRIVDVLFGLVRSGVCENSVITVDVQDFLKTMKRHKKWEQLLDGLMRFGFEISEFNRKSASFEVKYPSNPMIITVLYAYVKGADTKPCHWYMDLYKNSLSYRFIEASQEYEFTFLAAMDDSSEELRKVQYWLYDEAKKYGYTIDLNEPMEKGCVLYKKGSKRFILVGDSSWFSILSPGEISTKVIYRKAFELAPDKMSALAARFPDTFKSNCKRCKDSCNMRIVYDMNGETQSNCAYNSFMVNGFSLKDLSEILELFIIENKILPLKENT